MNVARINNKVTRSSQKRQWKFRGIGKLALLLRVERTHLWKVLTNRRTSHSLLARHQALIDSLSGNENQPLNSTTKQNCIEATATKQTVLPAVIPLTAGSDQTVLPDVTPLTAGSDKPQN